MASEEAEEEEIELRTEELEKDVDNQRKKVEEAVTKDEKKDAKQGDKSHKQLLCHRLGYNLVDVYTLPAADCRRHS